MTVEYMFKLISTVSTILQKQTNVITEYEKWDKEYQERTKSPKFWEAAIKGLNPAETANIIYIMNRFQTIISDMTSVSEMNDKQRAQSVSSVNDIVKRLGRANESLIQAEAKG
ncbi:MAG: hypothetical protein V3U49_01285 [Nitrososphaerales archaeon]